MLEKFLAFSAGLFDYINFLFCFSLIVHCLFFSFFSFFHFFFIQDTPQKKKLKNVFKTLRFYSP